MGFVCAACALTPDGLDDEAARLDGAGASYARPLEERELPALPAVPTWRDLLQRAFLANGALEADWQAWRAAVARVRAESTWPLPPVEVGFEWMFSDETMNAWDRASVDVGFDALEPFERPSQARTRGRVALSEARAAGERFRAAKFALQRRFLETWAEWRATQARERLAAEALEAARLAADAAERAVRSGADEREILRARAETLRAEDARARLAARRTQLALELSALAALPDATAGSSGSTPADPMHADATALERVADDGAHERAWPALDDARIFALAAEGNPELAELARDVRGRADALDLARSAWLPGVRPSAGFTGGVSQFLGLALTLPTAGPALRAEVERARAELERTRALARQTRIDVRARLAGELTALREAERAGAFLADTLLPLFDRLEASTRTAYAGGRADQREWIESLRLRLEARDAALEARAARDAARARIEEIVGRDVETWESAAKATDEHDPAQRAQGGLEVAGGREP